MKTMKLFTLMTICVLVMGCSSQKTMKKGENGYQETPVVAQAFTIKKS